jgi:hypothetical protein
MARCAGDALDECFDLNQASHSTKSKKAETGPEERIFIGFQLKRLT